MFFPVLYSKIFGFKFTIVGTYILTCVVDYFLFQVISFFVFGYEIAKVIYEFLDFVIREIQIEIYVPQAENVQTL